MNKSEKNKAVALCSNYAYLDKAETTIKSLLWHMKNLNIYLFNYDIPQEWFININQYVNQIGSHIFDKKFNPEVLNGLKIRKQWQWLNKMAYARFLIPKMIDAKRVLYLDCDTIVYQNIDDLFTISFNGKKLLAVKDYGVPDTYNSGVMVLNNEFLRQDTDLSNKLFKYALEHKLASHDQTVINEYFKGEIGDLPLAYNYQIGSDFAAYWLHRSDIMTLLNQVTRPEIIHYLTPDKPFNFLSTGRKREVWWSYHNLNWPEIVQKYTVYDARKIGSQKFKGRVFIFTRYAEINHLDELVKSLPNICFNIAAPTEMNYYLTRFVSYPNVHLYKVIIGKNRDKLIKEADAYLDINQGPKEKEIIDRIKSRHLPILSFKATADQNNNYDHYQVFADDDVSGMIKKIKQIIQNK